MSTERHDKNSDEPSHTPAGEPGGPAADSGDGSVVAGREHPRERTGRRSRATVVAVAAAVLLAGGGGAYWASASGSGGGDGKAAQTALQPLRFDGPGVNAPVSGEAMPAGGGDTYQLSGTLPKGPSSAAVHRASGGPDEAAVRHLASLLGVPGTVTTVGGSWRVGPTADGGGPSLLVGKDAPGVWSYNRLGPPPVTARPGSSVPGASGSGSANASGNSSSSASSGSSGSSSSSNSSGAITDMPAPVSPQRAEQAAAPLLGGLGLSGARTQSTQTIGALRLVDADPVVDGLPTHGWSTSVQVGADGRITSASGRLSPVVKGDTYPVVSAATALKELNAKTISGSVEPQTGAQSAEGTTSCRVPVPTMTPLAPGGSGDDLRRSEPCLPVTPHPVQVRGAVFGLSTQFVDGTQMLVPSWLFDTAQAGVTTTSVVAQAAVDPKYIRYGGGGVARPGGPATLPVSPLPVNPGGPIRTGPAQPSDPQAPHPVKFTAYHAQGTTLTVSFYGGLCGTYRASADETATQVRVRVTETPGPAGKVCPMIEKILTAQVSLKEPLGTRTVVDTTDGQPVRGQ